MAGTIRERPRHHTTQTHVPACYPGLKYVHAPYCTWTADYSWLQAVLSSNKQLRQRLAAARGGKSEKPPPQKGKGMPKSSIGDCSSGQVPNNPLLRLQVKYVPVHHTVRQTAPPRPASCPVARACARCRSAPAVPSMTRRAWGGSGQSLAACPPIALGAWRAVVRRQNGPEPRSFCIPMHPGPPGVGGIWPLCSEGRGRRRA